MAWTRPWALGAVMSGLVATHLLVPYRMGVVVGDSMKPSMKHGQVYLIDRMDAGKNAKVGDVLVFNRDGQQYIKRVVATPGDSIYLVKPETGDDMLVMDWQFKFLKDAAVNPHYRTGKFVKRTLSPGQFYVVGDNLDGSVDSRSFGPITAESVIGKVVNPPKQIPRLFRVVRHHDQQPGI